MGRGLVATVLLLTGACRVDAGFAGSHYRCDPAGTPCPPGRICVAGFCEETGVDAAPCGKVESLLSDEFEGTELSDQWGQTAGCLVTGGRLECPTFADMAGRYLTVSSHRRFDLRGSRVFVELPEMVDVTTAAEGHFVAKWDCCAGDAVHMFQKQGLLHSARAYAGDYIEAGVEAYDPVLHRWWQMRESGSVVHFETSEDGAAWVERASVSTPPFAGFVSIELASGTGVAIPAPAGSVAFDHLNGGLAATGAWCRSASLSDDFSASERSFPWQERVMGACTVGQPSGTLEVTVNTGSAIDCFYFSSAAYDLTESEVVVEVPATAATGTTYASLREPSGIALEITVRDGDIHFGDAAVMPYSATDHRWWRFRADAAGAVAFDSAPDGATWLERGTVTPAFSLRALAVHLGVRTTSSSATSVARFDNVNLAP